MGSVEIDSGFVYSSVVYRVSERLRVSHNEALGIIVRLLCTHAHGAYPHMEGSETAAKMLGVSKRKAIEIIDELYSDPLDGYALPARAVLAPSICGEQSSIVVAR